MIFDALVVGYARGSALRALVSIVAIAFGVATALALESATARARSGLTADRALYAHHVDFEILPYTAGVPTNLVARIRALDGVASAEPIVDRTAVIVAPPRAARAPAQRLLGVDLLQPLPGVTGFAEALPGPFAPAGAFIVPRDVLTTSGAILTATEARRLRLRRYDTFVLDAGAGRISLRVANVLPPSAHGVDPDTIFLDVARAQRAYGLGDRLDRIDVVTSTPAALVAPQLRAILGLRARLADPRADAAALADLTAGLDATFGTLAAISLVIGGLLVAGAVGTSVAQRRPDIGTLRALGAAPHEIVAAFVAEGAAYGAVGATSGVGLAIAAGDGATTWPLVRAAAGGIAIAVIAAIVPALSAARLAPAAASRPGTFERAASRARSIANLLACAACFALAAYLAWHPHLGRLFTLGLPLAIAAGGACIAPLLLGAAAQAARRFSMNAPVARRLAATFFAATPQRLAVALGALAAAIYAAIAFDITSASFEHALHGWAERTLAGDLVLRPASAAEAAGAVLDARTIARARATPGVIATHAERTLHLRSGATDVAVRGEDASDVGSSALPSRVPTAQGSPVPADLGARLAATLKVRPGDDLAVRDAAHTLRLRVAAVRPDFDAGPGVIVVARSALARAFGDARVDTLRLTLGPDRDVDSVRSALERRASPAPIALTTLRDVRAGLERDFGATFALARTLAALVVAAAVFGIVSAFAALVAERRFDLRMLRRLGASRGTLVHMLVLESSAVVLCATSLGTGLAFVLALAILDAADPLTLGFALPLRVPLEAIVPTLGLASLAAVLGTTIGLGPAARIAADALPARMP